MNEPPECSLTIVIHSDGDDFTEMRLAPEHVRMTIMELETRTMSHFGGLPTGLGVKMRGIAQELRRIGKREFIFDPSDRREMFLSPVWLLGARQALEDTMWFLRRFESIFRARRGSLPELSARIEHGAIIPHMSKKRVECVWICEDCSSPVSPRREVCDTPDCPSHERYTRCTGIPVNIPLREKRRAEKACGS